MTLGGHTLPSPFSYQVHRDYRGGIAISASGALVEDVLSSSAKRTWIMEFKNISSAQKSTMETAFAAIIGATATFVDLDGSNPSPTVTRSDEQRALVWTYVRTAGSIRYNTTMVLREV